MSYSTYLDKTLTLVANLAKTGYNYIIMKANIHPKYFDQAQVICACSNKFTVGSTKPEFRVELCSNCHPFYTGEQRFVDSASRIQQFQKKQEKAKVFQSRIIKKKEEQKQKDQGPKTLREMLMAVK